ncbi:LpxI family protein [Primorskyibacter marinus]|uniref:LpxI family protein n=1 Tax=Primorskyibacter marinus TaxID=1977320 RepID=UPI000E3024AE|nr:UDP-2,3-diacylglucosamine diphosphatase LpxI [Primorskyibacter marinus]
MAGRLGLLAGSGQLPPCIFQAHPDAYCVTLKGMPHDLPNGAAREHRIEQLGALFDDLRAQGVTRVVMAGAMARPELDPAIFDAETVTLAPAFKAALHHGDDGLLRHIVALFEERGFGVIGAHELVAGLTASAGLLCGPEPDDIAKADTERAAAVLSALSPLDLGQAAIVAGGLCLGIETLQGTDALLDMAAATQPERRPRAPGVLVKQPKHGQDLRVDMPSIGPRTIEGAKRAGLGGIVIAAGGVLILDRDATLSAAKEAGIFLQARDV